MDYHIHCGIYVLFVTNLCIERVKPHPLINIFDIRLYGYTFTLCIYQCYAPLPLNLGYIGEKVGHLTCFDTKTCPICGEFDLSPYACATIKIIDGQIPHLLLDL